MIKLAQFVIIQHSVFHILRTELITHIINVRKYEYILWFYNIIAIVFFIITKLLYP